MKKKTVRIGIGQDTTSSNILFDGSRKIISKPEEVKSKFFKNFKKPSRKVELHLCTKYHNHSIFWWTIITSDIFFTFWDLFGPFPDSRWKIQNFENTKKVPEKKNSDLHT